MSRLIHALHPDSFIRWANDDSTLYGGCSARAFINFRESSNQAIIRAFPVIEPRGLLNQCIYWIICSAAGLHVSPRCWLMPLYTDLLRTRWPDEAWPARAETTVLVEELPSASIPIQPLGWSQADTLRRCLRDWDKLPTAVALHEWVAHYTNSITAIAETARDQYTLTDGHAILGSSNWTSDQLDRIPQPLNRLAWLAWGGQKLDTSTLARLHVAGEPHAALFERVAHLVMYITWELTDRATMLAVAAALRSRAVEDFIAHRFGDREHARLTG